MQAVPTAPTFRPTAEEFRDPIQYIEKIRPEAEKYVLLRSGLSIQHKLTFLLLTL